MMIIDGSFLLGSAAILQGIAALIHAYRRQDHRDLHTSDCRGAPEQRTLSRSPDCSRKCSAAGASFDKQD